jgi:tetratricopeptide (TPR) repeat protein
MRGQRALKAPAVARAGLTASVAVLYQRALRLNPQDPVLWRNWAATQANLLEDKQGALASAQRVLSLEPRNAAAFGLVADIQLKRAAAQAGEARRATYLEAAKAYERARSLAPGEPSYRVNEGKALFGAGEREKAIASWRAALRVLPAESRGGQAVAMLLQRAEAGEPQ